jgi:hypothetical protein
MNNKVEHIAIKYLNEMYGDLRGYKTGIYPDRVFYVKDKKIYMQYTLKTKLLYVDYDTIWTDLKKIIGLESGESQCIITKWVGETYKLTDVSSHPDTSYGWLQVDETYKLY